MSIVKGQTGLEIYQIDGEESERISMLKLWLSIMVVFVHSSTGSEVFFADRIIVQQCPAWLDWSSFVISKAISCCAVPWFFFLSGLFLYRKPFRWLNNVKKKVRTLLIPYLILNTFWLAFYFIAQHTPVVSAYFANPDNIISNYTLSDFADAYLGWKMRLRATVHDPFLGPLWFMRDLMVLNLLAPVMKEIIDRFPKAVFAVLMTLLLLDVHVENAIFCLSTAGIVYFSLGYYCVKYQLHLKDLDKTKAFVALPLYVAAIAVSCLLRGSSFHYLCGLALIFMGGGIFFIYGTRIKIFFIKKAVLYLSQYSTSIYLFHQMNMLILQKLITRVLPTNVFTQMLSYFGIPLLIVAFCIMVSVLLKKFVPRVYSLVTGNR